MMKYISKFKINNYTYVFFLICALCGYIKNISIIFFICFIHELGHIFFIKLFKYKIIKIEFYPFGGFTKLEKKINTSINKDLVIAFGGIFFQIVFILILFLLKNKINFITYNLFVNYNLILILFNMIPIIPLDGNNIIHLLLEKFFSYYMSYYINFIISIICLVLFLMINYIYHLDNYFIISFLFYKSVEYIKNFKYLKHRFLIERYLYDFEYRKIDNDTKNIKHLRRNVFHYFKENNKYISEKNIIKRNLNI